MQALSMLLLRVPLNAIVSLSFTLTPLDMFIIGTFVEMCNLTPGWAWTVIFGSSC